MVARNFITVPGEQFIAEGTGAVERTVESKLQDTVSVKDFGAVGDGVTNDTAAVHAARDALGTGKLYFPAGIYKGNFVFNKGIRVVGAGRNKTVFKAQSSASPILHFTDANASTYFYTGGEHFTVDGESTAVVGVKIGTGTPGLGTVTYGSLEYVFIDRCIDNIYVKDTVGFEINHVRCYRSTNNNLKIDANDIATVLDVRNSQFTLSSDTGLYLGGGAIINFTSCAIESNANIGLFFFRQSSSGSRQVKFTSCWFEDNVNSPSTGAASGVFIDINPASPEFPCYIEFNNCLHSSNGSSRNIFIQRGQAAFNQCTFDALTSTRLYAEAGNGTAYGVLTDCGTVDNRPSPTLYTNFPALSVQSGGANLVGFIYDYDYRGHRYTNRKPAAFAWYIVTSAVGIAATGAGTEYTTTTLAGVSSNYLLYDNAGNFASGAFTAPQTGNYEFEVLWPMTNFNTSMSDVEVAFIQNPSGSAVRFVAHKENLTSLTTSDLKTFKGSRQLRLSEGDVVVATVKISGAAGDTAEVYRNVTSPGLFTFSGNII